MPGPAISKPHRINKQITVVSGTPQRLVSVDTPSPVYVNRLFIQGRANAAPGIGYVLGGVPLGTALNATDATQLTAELAPSTATAPGGSFGDPTGSTGGWNSTPPNDLREWALDSSQNGVFIVSYDLRD